MAKAQKTGTGISRAVKKGRTSFDMSLNHAPENYNRSANEVDLKTIDYQA